MEIVTYAETVPSWFLLNLKVVKLHETYYSSTEKNTEFEVQKSFVFCLGSNETATCLFISVNIEIPRSLYLNMQRDSQWQYIQVGNHSHVRDRASCPRNTTEWN